MKIIDKLACPADYTCNNCLHYLFPVYKASLTYICVANYMIQRNDKLGIKGSWLFYRVESRQNPMDFKTILCEDYLKVP